MTSTLQEPQREHGPEKETAMHDGTGARTKWTNKLSYKVIQNNPIIDQDLVKKIGEGTLSYFLYQIPLVLFIPRVLF